MFGLIVCVWSHSVCLHSGVKYERQVFSEKDTGRVLSLCVLWVHLDSRKKQTERAILIAADCRFQFWRARQ